MGNAECQEDFNDFQRNYYSNHSDFQGRGRNNFSCCQTFCCLVRMCLVFSARRPCTKISPLLVTIGKLEKVVGTFECSCSQVHKFMNNGEDWDNEAELHAAKDVPANCTAMSMSNQVKRPSTYPDLSVVIKSEVT